jgi:hypothetical protein
MGFYGNFATLRFTTMRRLWKTGKKTGRSKEIAHFYGNFWSKIGQFG